MGKEIERKWLLEGKPEWADAYPHTMIVQGYICTEPVIRIRRDGDAFYLTVKGKGKVSREEVNLPMTEETFRSLYPKCEGIVIEKTRYRIPILADGSRLTEAETGDYTAELDVFHGVHEGRIYVEVEFAGEEEAEAFEAPAWFGREVTGLPEYTNAALSKG